MNNVKHLSQTNEHYTPTEIGERVHALLGGIDLDPASSASANVVVRATSIFTSDDNGLQRPWHGRLFLNPPGGKDSQGRSNSKQWWFKLVREWLAGNVISAVFVGFSIELLQTCQVDAPEGMPLPFDYPFVIPKHRIEFLRDVDGKLMVGASPTHANVIVFLPAKMDWGNYSAFERIFGDLGRVVMPRWRRVPLRPRPRATSARCLVSPALAAALESLPAPTHDGEERS